jgi:hypothetical protein
MVENIEETGKINSAQQEADWRHDNAINQGRHDFAKGYSDDHGDGQINDISPSDEFFEFFDNG